MLIASNPTGILEAPRSRIYKIGDVQIPVNRMLKKHFMKEKKAKFIPFYNKKIHENGIVASLEVTRYMPTNKASQKSHPVLSNKIGQKITFKRIKNNSKNKDKTKAFNGRVYSAVRSNSQLK
jgi:hypothetical protein